MKKIVVTTNSQLIPAKRNYEAVDFVLKNIRENSETIFAGDYLDYELEL